MNLQVFCLLAKFIYLKLALPELLEEAGFISYILKTFYFVLGYS